jgi:hypothetical protein
MKTLITLAAVAAATLALGASAAEAHCYWDPYYGYICHHWHPWQYYGYPYGYPYGGGVNLNLHF